MIDPQWQGSRPMICVAVTYIIKAGHEVRAVELFRELTGPTRVEPGCRIRTLSTARLDHRPQEVLPVRAI